MLAFNLSNAGNAASYNTYCTTGSSAAVCANSPCTTDCIQRLMQFGANNPTVCCQNCSTSPMVYNATNGIYLDSLLVGTQLVVVDPRGYATSSSLPLTFAFEWVMTLSTTNAWFYWEVILSCLLIFNFVVLTGITMHMYLKYKKSTEKLVKYQLTQTNDHQKQT